MCIIIETGFIRFVVHVVVQRNWGECDYMISNWLLVAIKLAKKMTVLLCAIHKQITNASIAQQRSATDVPYSRKMKKLTGGKR